METKTNLAIALFKLGRYKEAFAIFKTFKRGFSKEQKRAIEIASECVNNLARCQFYESIGVDAKQLCVDAYCVIIDKYCKGQE